ncbi:MAG: MarR family winged helix-turn-helix transcriptional regulator [Moorellales bacterium]
MSSRQETEIVARLEAALRGLNYLLNFLTKTFLKEEGLTLPRLWALLHLARCRNLTMSELQERLLVSPGSVTALIDGLVAEGLVERYRDEEDRRVVRLSLSPAGRAILERVLAFRRNLVAEAFTPTREDEGLLARLEAAQRRLEGRIRRRRPPGETQPENHGIGQKPGLRSLEADHKTN